MLDSKVKLVPYSRIFLDKSWIWLNDPEIKKLTDTPNFTKKEQETFFSSLPKDGYYIWGISYGDKEIGVAGLKNIVENSAEYFGYIGEKSFWSKGLFYSIISLIKGECKEKDIKIIRLNVSVDNSMAIKAYEKNKFEVVFSLSTAEKYHMLTRVNE